MCSRAARSPFCTLLASWISSSGVNKGTSLIPARYVSSPWSRIPSRPSLGRAVLSSSSVANLKTLSAGWTPGETVSEKPTTPHARARSPGGRAGTARWKGTVALEQRVDERHQTRGAEHEQDADDQQHDQDRRHPPELVLGQEGDELRHQPALLAFGCVEEVLIRLLARSVAHGWSGAG